MSPEIINFMSYDLKTDIWSLGCILYELCSLKRPFDGNNIVVLRKLITNGKYEPIPSFYSENLRKLVSRMLSINPKHRPTINDILPISIHSKTFIRNEQSHENTRTLINNKI